MLQKAELHVASYFSLECLFLIKFTSQKNGENDYQGENKMKCTIQYRTCVWEHRRECNYVDVDAEA